MHFKGVFADLIWKGHNFALKARNHTLPIAVSAGGLACIFHRLIAVFRQMAGDRNLPEISGESSDFSRIAHTTPFPPERNPNCQPLNRTQKRESAAGSSRP